MLPRRLTDDGTVSQPDSKRKTLVERAGESLKSQIPSAGSGLPRTAVNLKGASIAALSSSALPAATSRHVPASNFAKSVGPGARPPPTSRAPTSMGFNQSTNVRPRGVTRTRPATSMANREMEDEGPQPNQQKGMEIPDSFQLQRQRKPKAQKPPSQQLAPLHAREASREVSGLRGRFETLSMNDQPLDSSSGGQAVSLSDQQSLSRPS